MKTKLSKYEELQLNLQIKIEDKQSSNKIKQEFIALDYCSFNVFMHWTGNVMSIRSKHVVTQNRSGLFCLKCSDYGL